MKYDLSQFKDKKVMIEINGNEELLQACQDQFNYSTLFSAEDVLYFYFDKGVYGGWATPKSKFSIEELRDHYYTDDTLIIPLSFWEEKVEEPVQSLYEYTQQAYGDVTVTTQDTKVIEAYRAVVEDAKISYKVVCSELKEAQDLNKALRQHNDLLRVKVHNQSNTIHNLQIQDNKRFEVNKAQKEQLKVLGGVILKRNMTIKALELEILYQKLCSNLKVLEEGKKHD